jgi:hypothetical protein
VSKENGNDGFEMKDDAPTPRAEAPASERREERREEPRREERNTRRDRDDREEGEERAFTIADIGRTLNVRPSSGGLSDAALSALMAAFEKNKAFDKPNLPDAIKRDRFKVIPLDGSLAKSSLNSLLVTLPIVIGAGKATLVYVLTIEPAGGHGTRSQVDRGTTYDAIVLPEDQLATKPYKRAIEDQVAGLNKDAKVVVIGSQVLLSSVVAKLNKEENSAVVDRIFDNALDALCGYRENLVDKAGGSRNSAFRISPKMIGRTGRLETTWNYSGQPGEDSSGQPIRSDCTGNLFYSEASNEDDNQYDRTPMGEIRAGIDLFLADDREQSSGPSFSRRRKSQEDGLPFIQAVLNITSIAPAPNFPFSLELALLLLAQANLQSNDYRWASQLRPRTAISNPDGTGVMKPTSNINCLHLLNPNRDFAKIFDDVSPNMDDNDLSDYLAFTVFPKLAIGMMIPSSGEKSSVLSIFESIATTRDTDVARRHTKTLFEAADVLSGNRFSRAYKDLAGSTDVAPVRSMGTRQLIGTWVDTQGNVRDLREWNVQSLLTEVGEKNIDLVTDFQYTYENDRNTVDFCLAERLAYLQKVVPGIRVTTTAPLLGFEPDFLEALSRSLDAADMSSYMTAEGGLNTRRHVGGSNWSQLATSDIGISRRRGSDRTTADRGRGGLFDTIDY